MMQFGADTPHVFAQPLGCDFPRAVVEGLRARCDPKKPEQLARVTLIINTTRMARRVQAIITEQGPGFLPRILVLGELEALLTSPPPKVLPPQLAQKLQLAQLLKPVLAERPELGAQSAMFDLCDSLIALLNEMHGEGVTAETISAHPRGPRTGP